MYTKNSTTKRKSILILVFIFCLFFAFSCQAAEYLTVTKDGINVRKGPSTSEPVVMELFSGWPVKVLSTKGDWYQIVDYENDKGWIHKSLVKKNDTAIVNVSRTGNMRSGPGKNNAIVAEVERGVVLTRLETKGSWVKVKHSQGTVGWIYKTLLWPAK